MTREFLEVLFNPISGDFEHRNASEGVTQEPFALIFNFNPPVCCINPIPTRSENEDFPELAVSPAEARFGLAKGKHVAIAGSAVFRSSMASNSSLKSS